MGNGIPGIGGIRVSLMLLGIEESRKQWIALPLPLFRSIKTARSKQNSLMIKGGALPVHMIRGERLKKEKNCLGHTPNHTSVKNIQSFFFTT